MLWPLGDFDSAYANIRVNTLQGGCSVLIIAALEVDALCSLNILVKLFKSDSVSYSTKTVRGQDDLLMVCSGLLKNDHLNDDLRSIIFLNCGGDMDLDEIVADKERFIYCVDSRRPFFPRNIDPQNSQVIVLADVGDDVDLIHRESQEKEFRLSKKRKVGSLVDVNLFEKENEAEILNREEYSNTNFSIKSDNDEIEEVDFVPVSKFGQPSVHSLFSLAQQLNKLDADVLWLCAIGVSSQWMKINLTEEDYLLLMNEYTSQSNALPKPLEFNGSGPSIESKLFLHRHIEFYSSLILSEKICSDFGIPTRLGDKILTTLPGDCGDQWTFLMTGTPKLDTFLAKQGLPLSQCKSKLSSVIKKKFLSAVKVEGLKYPSFNKKIGYGREFCALDVVHCVEAVISSDEDTSSLAIEILLDLNLVKEYVEDAVEIRRVICSVTSKTISKKLISSSGDFRFVLYSNLLPEEENVLRSASNLYSLGRFIMEMNTSNEKWLDIHFKPLLLGVEYYELDTFPSVKKVLLVAVENSIELPLLPRVLRLAFKQAIKEAEIKDFEVPRFDCACVVLDASQKDLFIATLYEVLITSKSSEKISK